MMTSDHEMNAVIHDASSFRVGLSGPIWVPVTLVPTAEYIICIVSLAAYGAQHRHSLRGYITSLHAT